MKKIAIFLAALMASSAITACQSSETEAKKAPADTETVNEAADNENNSEEIQSSRDEEVIPNEDTGTELESNTEEESTGEPLSEVMVDNFSADPKAVADYAALIKEAVAQKDMERLADLTGFPVYVGLEGVGVVETREDFLVLDPAAVFSEAMCASIEAADASDLAPSKAGFTLMGDGENPSITFGVVNGELRIKGINY